MELRLADIPDREFEVLHAAVLRLLYEYGMLFEHREANEILVTHSVPPFEPGVERELKRIGEEF